MKTAILVVFVSLCVLASGKYSVFSRDSTFGLTELVRLNVHTY